MTRSETSLSISRLVLLIDQERKLGLHRFRVAIDYAKRSAEEQRRLFDAKKSKLDGYEKISAHQTGRAFDLLLFDENGVYVNIWPPSFVKRYHDLWETWGGKPLIEWDTGHFEG